VRIVVADTGPLSYLVLIGHIELLPMLFQEVIIPMAVRHELVSRNAPPLVRDWIATAPAWLDFREICGAQSEEHSLSGLDPGEKEAILLASSLDAELLLIDDRKGMIAAQRLGLRVTGTIGILDLAAERRLVDFAQAIRQLEETNFRRPREILEMLLAKHMDR
jgi:predicted nucleic acid-binding protein